MFADIDAECYLMIDGDDTYPAENAREMVDIILNKKADMVIGDRLSSTYFNENKRPFHNIGNKLVRFLINMLFKNNIRDIMTGYRAFSYEFVKTFPVLSKGFEIETEMTIHALDKNMGVKNVIVTYRDRPEGSQSKLNTYSDGIKVIKTIANLFKNYRPFSFCATLGTILLLITAGLFIPVFIDYLKTGLVQRFPTLIVSGFLGLVSVHFYFSGIILNVIAHHQKQEFEFRLNQVKQYKKIDKNKNYVLN